MSNSLGVPDRPDGATHAQLNENHQNLVILAANRVIIDCFLSPVVFLPGGGIFGER
jgi:hypothetical protein